LWALQSYHSNCALTPGRQFMSRQRTRQRYSGRPGLVPLPWRAVGASPSHTSPRSITIGSSWSVITALGGASLELEFSNNVLYAHRGNAEHRSKYHDAAATATGRGKEKVGFEPTPNAHARALKCLINCRAALASGVAIRTDEGFARQSPRLHERDDKYRHVRSIPTARSRLHHILPP